MCLGHSVIYTILFSLPFRIIIDAELAALDKHMATFRGTLIKDVTVLRVIFTDPYSPLPRVLHFEQSLKRTITRLKKDSIPSSRSPSILHNKNHYCASLIIYGVRKCTCSK